MPTTPRAQSIRLARSDHVGPVGLHAKDNSGQGKIDHYAYLARFMHAGVERFLADPAHQAEINQTTSARTLEWVIRDGLYDTITLGLTQPDHVTLSDHLEDSQRQRMQEGHPVWETIDTSIKAGLSTYIDTTHGLYSLLADGFGADMAAHPGNAAILDRISKLNIKHFIAYKHIYLDDAADDYPIVHLHEFIEQLEPSPRGGLKFKPNYPGLAHVTVATTLDLPMLTRGDLLLINGKTVALQDAPPRRRHHRLSYQLRP